MINEAALFALKLKFVYNIRVIDSKRESVSPLLLLTIRDFIHGGPHG